MKKLLMCVLGAGFFLGSVSDMYGKCSEQKTESNCNITMEIEYDFDPVTQTQTKISHKCAWANNVCQLKSFLENQ